MNEYLYLLVMSVTGVVVLFIISKLLGKKQIAQLEFIDYVVGISIGSIAAEMATDISDKPIQYYIIAMVIFFLFDIFVSFIGRKNPVLKHFFKGRPIMVIYEGNLDYNALKKSKLDVNDVIGMCREQGFFDLSDIAYAIFENSGKLSILPVADKAPATAKDTNAPLEKPSLPFYMVVDGRISFSSLTELQKDKAWLLSELNVTDEKELKDIILCVYDDKAQKLKTTYKKQRQN